MPIIRNTKQSEDKDLNRFYTELTSDNNDVITKTIGNNMLAFIEMINQTFVDTQIWGLTSLYRLVLQTKDQWDTEWFVIISCIGSNEYYFEYLMTDDKRPWENATVKGVTQNLTEAKKYLLIAMRESCGWADNVELQKRLKENNL